MSYGADRTVQFGLNYIFIKQIYGGDQSPLPANDRDGTKADHLDAADQSEPLDPPGQMARSVCIQKSSVADNVARRYISPFTSETRTSRNCLLDTRSMQMRTS